MINATLSQKCLMLLPLSYTVGLVYLYGMVEVFLSILLSNIGKLKKFFVFSCISLVILMHHIMKPINTVYIHLCSLREVVFKKISLFYFHDITRLKVTSGIPMVHWKIVLL